MSSSCVVLGECKICFEEIELESFQVFPCGHSFCQSCVSDLFSLYRRQTIDCPLCRKKWRKADASKLVFFPVVVGLVDSPADNALEEENAWLWESKAELESKLGESSDSAEVLRTMAEELQGSLIAKEEELDRVMHSFNRLRFLDKLRSKTLEVLQQKVEILTTKLQEKENRIDERNIVIDPEPSFSFEEVDEETLEAFNEVERNTRHDSTPSRRAHFSQPPSVIHSRPFRPFTEASGDPDQPAHRDNAQHLHVNINQPSSFDGMGQVGDPDDVPAPFLVPLTLGALAARAHMRKTRANRLG